MDQTREMMSPDSLMDAEGDADSSFGETSWPESDAAETQADVLCNMGAIDGNSASGHTGIASCLPEHSEASTASQMGATVDQAMDQAMTSTSVSEPSYMGATMTSTSVQETEQRLTQPPSSPHRVVSATEPDGAMHVREDDTQPVTHSLNLSIESSAIDEQTRANSGPITDDQDDSGVVSASSSECRAGTETTSLAPHTASYGQDASSGSVTHGSTDLPEDELSESIIIDDNGGEPIVIDTSDEEVADDKPRPNPRRRAQRKRVSTQSPVMVNWTSKEYETRTAASLSAAWKEVWKQWGQIHTNADRQLAQILDPFHEIMSNVWGYELWNEKYRKHDGRRVYRAWVRYGMEKRVRDRSRPERDGRLMRKLGKALKRLREAEEEQRSIAVTMDDGDSGDCEYVPTQTRRQGLSHSRKSLG